VVGRGAEKVAPEQICQPLLEVGHGAVLGAEMVGKKLVIIVIC